MGRPHTMLWRCLRRLCVSGVDLHLHILAVAAELLRLLVKQFISLMHFVCASQLARRPRRHAKQAKEVVRQVAAIRNVWKWRNGSAFQWNLWCMETLGDRWRLQVLCSSPLSSKPLSWGPWAMGCGFRAETLTPERFMSASLLRPLPNFVLLPLTKEFQLNIIYVAQKDVNLMRGTRILNEASPLRRGPPNSFRSKVVRCSLVVSSRVTPNGPVSLFLLSHSRAKGFVFAAFYTSSLPDGLPPTGAERKWKGARVWTRRSCKQPSSGNDSS